MNQPSQPAFTASPTSIDPGSARSPLHRPPLPDRSINSDSIEETYVAFILHCNPAVPPGTDSTALREAFRTPPKSGGKSFSTFTLFELIKQLETKELKTWAELALKLGVEPPDQEKGQSSQKIQQYAVRLKRWMHSMHVDAFFEYLMDRPHPYWTDPPADSTPITETGRDGVAAEDDMALRALLPQIKPRRGRRKPEDEDGKSPSQRPSPLQDEYPSAVPHDGNTEPWSAHPSGRGSAFMFPPGTDPLRLSASMGQPLGAQWSGNDVAQTPLTATPLTAYPSYPHSAITPITRNAFWADPSEPKSAITSSKPRSSSRRHGAKVVSSAWRSGGVNSSGKTRGRPPINRGGNPDGPFSAFPAISETATFKLPSPTPDRNIGSHNATTRSSIPPPEPSPTTLPTAPLGPPPVPPALPASMQPQEMSQPSSAQEAVPPRPAKRSRLSLQVPARVGGSVRLATPPPPTAPPVVMVNGQTQEEPMAHKPPSINNHQVEDTAALFSHHSGTFGAPPMSPAAVDGAVPTPHQAVAFRDPTDRTHIDELYSIFVYEVLVATWLDAEGNKITPCNADEAWGLSQTVIDGLLRAAATKEAFLINLSALAGGKLLMPSGSLRVTRVEQLPDRNSYSCEWELRFGDIRGTYTMQETVLHQTWEGRGRQHQQQYQGGKDDGSATAGAEDGINSAVEEAGNAEYWQKKYQDVAGLLKKKDEELTRLRGKVMEALRDSI